MPREFSGFKQPFSMMSTRAQKYYGFIGIWRNLTENVSHVSVSTMPGIALFGAGKSSGKVLTKLMCAVLMSCLRQLLWHQQTASAVMLTHLNTLRPKQNGLHFADDIFKRIFLNVNIRISIEISLKCVPEGIINNIQALLRIMAWRRTGDNPLIEPMLVRLPTHIYVTRPQWVDTPCSLGPVWLTIFR